MNDNDMPVDEAFAALAAADPTRLSLDIEDMRALVDTGHHEHRAPRGRVAAASVAALIALGVGAAGGYQVAAMHSDAGTPSVQSATAAAAGAEPGDASVAASEQDRMSAVPAAGRALLEPGRALGDSNAPRVGYLLNGTVDRKQAMQRLADRFPLGSASRSADGSYTAGDPNGASATVGADPAATWWFTDAGNSPWNCAESSQAGTCAPISGEPMSDEAAIAAAQDLFSALGLDVEQADWTVADESWFGTGPDNNPVPFRHVMAQLQMDGMDTGLSWTADLAPDGAVSAATGFFAELSPTDAYATVGASTATRRSQDPRWSALGPVEKVASGGVVPLAGTSARDASAAPNPQATYDAAGRPLITDATETVTITKADQSLATYYLADGTTALLPAWDLSDGTRTWVQIAVADKYLVAAD